MALMPQIFGRGQFKINALRLEHDPDLTAHLVGLFGRVESHDHGAAASRDHQGREDAKHRGLAAAVGSEQSEQFGGADVERNSIQGGAAVVAVDQILNRDHRRRRRHGAGLRVQRDVIGGFRDHRVFYPELTSCAWLGRASGRKIPEFTTSG